MIVFRTLSAADASLFNAIIGRELDEAGFDDVALWRGTTDEDAFANYADVFPPLVLLTHREQCQRVLQELRLYAEDAYPHILDPLQGHTLIHLLDFWILDAEEDLKEGDRDLPNGRGKVSVLLESLHRIARSAFEDRGFLIEPERLANALLTGDRSIEFKQVDAEDYLQLFPDDIRARLSQAG